MFDETGDEEKSQGWTALILDTNGNGKRDAYVEPNQPMDPAKDKRFGGGGSTPWRRRRTDRCGDRCSASPARGPARPRRESARDGARRDLRAAVETPERGFSPRGGDVDRNGVYWAAMASGHMASFDRRKCKGPLNGPKATGQHCPEGWTFYSRAAAADSRASPTPGSAEGSYYTWVDQFDTLGLGANTPINTGNLSEGLLALKDGKWVVLRVPYPLGFYTKWLDGRIDDPNAGWKGRASGPPVSTRTPFHMETGKGRRARSTSSRCGRIRWRSKKSASYQLGLCQFRSKELFLELAVPDQPESLDRAVSQLPIQIFRKLIGSLGSPCDCSLIGAESYALYYGWPM